MLVQFIYPVVQFNSIMTPMTEDEIEAFHCMNQEEKAKHILKLNEALPDPEITSQKLIEDALDTEYARIEVVKPRPDRELSTSVNEKEPLSTISSTNDESQSADNQP